MNDIETFLEVVVLLSSLIGIAFAVSLFGAALLFGFGYLILTTCKDMCIKAFTAISQQYKDCRESKDCND